ncbi:MAG: alpha/beta hydrolase [Bacteroidales bacterium]|nr:alpha/beta hydrolase [Bacteroidales bacterium]
MKIKAIFCALLLCFSFGAAFAQSLDGAWSGRADLGDGMTLGIVFHIDGDKASMDSPDQGASGIAAEYSVENGRIIFRVPSIGLVYEGIAFGKSIMGSITQSGRSMPLTLKYGEPVVRRPQEPKAPFPYRTEEVSFPGYDGAMLAGTVSDAGGPIAVVFVSGSGSQNRDEELMHHKPFLLLADRLAREGVSSLRYDDRGVFGSEGDAKTITIQSNADDARAAIAFARSLGYGKVGVIGHSEGGTISFLLGSDGGCDFLVSLAGSAADGEEIVLSQNKHAMLKAGYTEEDFEGYRETILSKIRETGRANPWYGSFLAFDPAPYIKKISCPAFILNGSLDTQVDPVLNLGIIRECLPEGNLIREYPGLNHLFQHCTSGELTEYNSIEETMSEEVISDIINWIKAL